ncbi:MAG: esterase family protein [Oscillospiraceae bacterium]|nr:esterase family protein [Oscillospiraceae bacterium]
MLEQHTLTSRHLGREVRLQVHLPDGCAPGQRFPVLYCYDGDVVFREGAEGFCYASYALAHRDSLPQILLVGISPPRDRWQRTAEFSPYTKVFETHGADFEPLVRGRGELLLAFVAQELKPWVDARYPTLPERAHTAIGGMSSGALNATYAILRHGNLFSRALLHSPAYNLWLPELLQSARGARLDALAYCYMDVGTEDETRMTAKEDALRSAQRMRDELLHCGLDARRLRFRVIPAGRHSPATWRQSFPDALRWVFQDCITGPASNPAGAEPATQKGENTR